MLPLKYDSHDLKKEASQLIYELTGEKVPVSLKIDQFVKQARKYVNIPPHENQTSYGPAIYAWLSQNGRVERRAERWVKPFREYKPAPHPRADDIKKAQPKLISISARDGGPDFRHGYDTVRGQYYT